MFECFNCFHNVISPLVHQSPLPSGGGEGDMQLTSSPPVLFGVLAVVSVQSEVALVFVWGTGWMVGEVCF